MNLSLVKPGKNQIQSVPYSRVPNRRRFRIKYRRDFFWKAHKRIGLNKRIGRIFFQKRIEV